MILTVDLGNTNITIGGFSRAGSLQFVSRLLTDSTLGTADYIPQIVSLMDTQSVLPAQVEGTALSSVVPTLTSTIAKAVQVWSRTPVKIVGSDLIPRLPVRGYDVSTLGSDRVVDAVSSLSIWKPPLVVFDLGTATTMSVVDKDGAFIGGMILPGLRLSVDALSARVSQLPSVTFRIPQSLIGTDTVSCMQSGALYGTAAAVEGLIQRVERFLGSSVTAILTGGLAQDVLPCLLRRVEYDENLLLKGLWMLFLENS